MIINKNYENKNCYVFGLGQTGKSIYNCLHASGANVFVWDDNHKKMDLPISMREALKEPAEVNWTTIDYLILSPGVPLHFPEPHFVVKLAQSSNTKIISDIEILYEAAKNSTKFIGITGTNGKSTTTSLIYHILQFNKITSQVGGNIGIPVLDLEAFSKNGTYVLEQSSFQLDLLHDVTFDIAILLNITKDHIDRHGTFENYIKVKCKVFEHQNHRNFAIISVDNDTARKVYEALDIKSKKVPVSSTRQLDYGVSYVDGEIIFNLHGHKGKIDIKPLDKLPGRHNRENIAASFAVGLIYNLSPNSIVKAIETFEPLNHRMEFVKSIKHISFYNDSKATNAEASIAALESFKNIFWLAGGVSKEGGINELEPYFKNINKAYLYGKSKNEFALTLKENDVDFEIFDNLEEATKQAYKDALLEKDPAYVILSPSCASYDQYKNFEERGDHFKQIIECL